MRLKIIVWLVALLLLGGVLSPAMAQETNGRLSPGVDIIFIVDQSGSMVVGPILDAESGLRGPPTDPDGLAIRAVRDGLSPILADIVQRELGREDMLQAETYRFGLVMFGDEVRVPIDLTPITVQREPDGTIISNIDGELPTENQDNLGDTAFSRAFDVTCNMLNCTAPPEEGRSRAVVVLTDGRPSGDDIGYTWTNPAPYYSELQRRHSALFEHAAVWVVGLDKNDQFWSDNQPFWNNLVAANGEPNRTRRVSNPQGISSTFSDIADQIIPRPPSEPRPCDTSFPVDPYKASLTLILEYPDFDSRAQFQLPDGSVLQKGGNVSHYVGSQSETFVVEDPPPGEWTCEITGGGVDTQFRDIQGAFRFAQVEVERHQGEVAPSTCRDFTLGISYLDHKGEFIEEIPGYPLEQTVTVTIDGEPEVRPLVQDESNPHQWQISDPLTPGSEGGKYPIAIDVRLTNGTPMFSETDEVFIDPDLPCMQILTPNEGSTSSIHNRMSVVPMEVEVQLTQAGEPAAFERVDDIFREDLGAIAQVHLQGPDSLTKTVALAPADDRPGVLMASIEDANEPGDYTLTAALQATTADGIPYELSTPDITFSRITGPWVRWGNYAQGAGMLLMMLLALAGIGFFGFLITGPFPRGTLIVEQKITGELAKVREWDQVKSFSLSKQRLFGLFRTRWINLKPPQGLGLRKLSVQHLSGRKGQDSGVRVTLVRQPDKSARKTGRKDTETLDFPKPGDKKSFGNGKYRIIYEDFGKKK
jgi:hypothetical protein